jgi:hypothetical protein
MGTADKSVPPKAARARRLGVEGGWELGRGFPVPEENCNSHDSYLFNFYFTIQVTCKNTENGELNNNIACKLRNLI